ncbi:hypothetical protein D9M70_418170 [compost metagenome]
MAAASWGSWAALVQVAAQTGSLARRAQAERQALKPASRSASLVTGSSSQPALL